VLRGPAEAGDAEAGFFLGEVVRWGMGGLADPTRALTGISGLAQGGYRPAARWLARPMRSGKGSRRPPGQAEIWARRAEGMAGEDRPRPGILAGVAGADGVAGATASEIIDEVGEALWAMKGYRILVAVLGSMMLAVAVAVVLLIPTLMAICVGLAAGLGFLALGMRLLGHRTPRPSRKGRHLEGRAEAGEAVALFRPGLRYEQGHHEVPKDLDPGPAAF